MIDIKSVVLEVTDRCNLRCKHCYQSLDSEVELRIEHILSFLTKMSQDFNITNIVISGGEPLLYEPLMELLEELSWKYNIRINTNGLLLDKYIVRLTKIPKLKIQISLDGYNNETYYLIRNSYVFDRVIENAIKAKEQGLNVIFRTTLTSITVEHYKSFIELSKRIDIPIVMKPIMNTGIVTQKDLMIDFKALAELKKKLFSEESSYYTIGNEGSTCGLIRENAKISTLIVDHLGNVYPCSALREKIFMIGNMQTLTYSMINNNFKVVVNNIKKILNSKRCIECNVRSFLGDDTCIVLCCFGHTECFFDTIDKECVEENV